MQQHNAVWGDTHLGSGWMQNRQRWSMSWSSLWRTDRLRGGNGLLDGRGRMRCVWWSDNRAYQIFCLRSLCWYRKGSFLDVTRSFLLIKYKDWLTFWDLTWTVKRALNFILAETNSCSAVHSIELIHAGFFHPFLASWNLQGVSGSSVIKMKKESLLQTSCEHTNYELEYVNMLGHRRESIRCGSRNIQDGRHGGRWALHIEVRWYHSIKIGYTVSCLWNTVIEDEVGIQGIKTNRS